MWFGDPALRQLPQLINLESLVHCNRNHHYFALLLDDARLVSSGSSSTLSVSGIKDQITLEVGSDPSIGSVRPIEYIGVESASARTQLWDGDSWGGFSLSFNENQQLGLYSEETGGDRYTRLRVDLTGNGTIPPQTGDYYLTGDTESVRFSPATWQNTTANNPDFLQFGDVDWGNGGTGTTLTVFGFTANSEGGLEEINWVLVRPETTLAGNANAIALGILWNDDGDGILEDNGNDSCVIKYALSVNHPSGQSYAFAQIDTVTQLNTAVGNVFIDSDNDGLGDEWEIEHFGNLTTASRDSNSDMDNYSDFDEFRAGTIPTDRNSYFRRYHKGTGFHRRFRLGVAFIRGAKVQYKNNKGSRRTMEHAGEKHRLHTAD